MSAQPQSIGASLSRFVTRAFSRPEVIPQDGVILGLERGRPVVDVSMAPVLVVGAVRVGKTAAMVVPTLLTWRKSAVVLDVQGEAEAITAEWREHGAGNKVRRLSFSEEDAAETYNPLDAIRSGTKHELSDLKLIAQVLLPGSETEAHELARGAFVGIVHAIKEAGNGLASVFNVLSETDGLGAFLKLWTLRSVETQAERFAANAANAYFRAGYEDRLGVAALLRTALAPFTDPIIAKNTAVSTFTLAELRQPGAAQTLFVKLRPSEIDRIRPLICLLFSQIATTGDADTAPLLMVLDEAGAIGPFVHIHAELHALEQRGIKLVVIAQSINQIEAQYGVNSKFWPTGPSSLIRLAFAPRLFEERQRLALAMAGSNPDRRAPPLAELEPPRLVVFWPGEPARSIEPLRYFESDSYRRRATN